jgi:hypothetical protein
MTRRIATIAATGSRHLRVGQHFASRQVALPAEFRGRYADDRATCHRFDGGRVYQIDRVRGLILRMFDTGG